MSDHFHAFWNQLANQPSTRRRCLAYYGLAEDVFAHRLRTTNESDLLPFLLRTHAHGSTVHVDTLDRFGKVDISQVAAPFTEYLFASGDVARRLVRRWWTPQAVGDAKDAIRLSIAALCALKEADDTVSSPLASLPALARIVAARGNALVGFVIELSRRMALDHVALLSSFDFDARAGIASVRFPLSDFHNGAQSVCVLTDALGKRVVYKPRAIQSDAAATALFDAVNAIAGFDAIVVPKALPRSGYGYSQFHEVSGSAVEEVSLVAAAWLVVATMIGGTHDLHNENVVVHGTQIVILDTECLMLPDRRPDRSTEPYAGFRRLEHLAERSVYTSRLAHSISLGLDGLPVNAAGLVGVERYGERFTRAFTMAYRAAAAHKPTLLAAIHGIPDADVRFVPRETRHYAEVAAWLHRRPLLASEVLRRLALTVLFADHPEHMSDEASATIFAHEASTLDRLDIPTFHVSMDSCALKVGSTELGDFFVGTAREMASARVLELGNDDLIRQSCILASLLRDAARIVPSQRRIASPPTPHDRVDPVDGPPSPWGMAPHRNEIDLASNVFADAPSNPAWLVVDVDSSGTGRSLRPVDASLYGGLGGAYLCASMAAGALSNRHTGDDLSCGLRTQLLQSVTESIGRANLGAVGAFDGFSGSLYALSKTSDPQDTIARAAISDGLHGANWSRILEIDGCDIISGLSGVLCVLLHLHGAGFDLAGPLASRAAEILADRALTNGLGETAKEDGFAHGILGVYYALARYNPPKPSLVSAATFALRERVTARVGAGAFHNNISWCRGIAGVLACGQAIDLEEIRCADAITGNLERLIEEATEYSLCCGVAGVAVSLAALSAVRPPSHWTAHFLSASRVRLASLVRHNNPPPPALEALGFMQGCSAAALGVSPASSLICATAIALA